jgi:hypothetical protein
MRKTPFTIALLAAAMASSAFAQSTARARPPGTMPLDDAPPPPPIVQPDTSGEPDVTKRVENGQTIEEFRLHGKLYMMRVTPAHGHPYVLMDDKGDGTFMRQDNPLDTGLRVPQWVLWEF